MGIEFQKVSVRFGEKIVFSSFSYSFGKEGIVGLSAPSGWGKTTLIRLILGLERPYAGRVILAENMRISCVFQENRLLPWENVLTNVMIGAKAGEKEASEMLQKCGIDFLEMKQFPHELSGGMLRRVSLARGLLASSQCLILDEPFSGLDFASKKELYPLILEYGQTGLVLLISHDVEEQKKLCHMILDLPKLCD